MLYVRFTLIDELKLAYDYVGSVNETDSRLSDDVNALAKALTPRASVGCQDLRRDNWYALGKDLLQGQER